MKYIRLLLFALFFAPFGAHAASSEFMVAAQLLSAAKNADIQQVELLVNNGADVNFIDATGLSLVCTALMNNDVRAAQILQMYGADASKCDKQIKKYKSRNKTDTGGGGLFSGLSSAQSIAIAAAGAAVVVGGLFLLTDVFDPGNDNDSGSSSGGGNRPNGGGGNSGGGATAAFTLPYGPAMPNAASESANYAANLNFYSPSETDSIYYKNFKLMTDGYKQNYLLMMHGYSPLARGYMGMRTLRNLASRAPISLAGNNLGPEPVLGGRPVDVAIITTNGINATSESSLGDRILPWTTTNDNGTTANPASNDMISSKYYNNEIIRGSDNSSIDDDKTVEDSKMVDIFDLSGHGTAINNAGASDMDNLLAKMVGGKDTGYASADFVGFMPNGQMAIFRTGGGSALKTVSGASPTGTYTMAGDALATGDTLTLFGKTLTVTRTGNAISATDGTTTYNGYLGADGLLYIDGAADGTINQAYTMANNNLTLSKELGTVDFLNYKALVNAAALYYSGDVANGRSRPDVLANAAVIAPLHGVTTETINDVLSLGTADARRAGFAALVNKYYDQDKTDGTAGANALPGTDAVAFFNGLGSTYSPLVLFSTGAFETDSAYSGKTLEATFENSAPLVFDNLEHLFMSIVAVGQIGNGTSGATSIAGYTPGNKYALSQWQDKNGTPDDTTDDKYYKSRVCGLGGKGANGIDPWCFAAAGVTDELAVASAAGAVGAIKSAFSYMNNKELFALIALTADGAYLGSTDTGTALTKDSLIAYLKTLYQMPTEYQYRWEHGGEDYLDVFKEVFGYGLINLERATKPNTKVYYYNGTDIVSGSGNAYWRAATNTVFRSSSAFAPRAATISAPFFDILTSVDGELSMPRIWANEFTIASDGRRGLYMGDVLGQLRTRNDVAPRMQIGNIGFTMAMSPRPYADNLNGLDNMRLDYTTGNWDMAAGYQHYFTDGASRFDGMSNPIFALATNAITSDFAYNLGRWSFGARAFSGAITDEELLDNDPTISSQYNPARLGGINGVQSHVNWTGDKFGFTAAVGAANETDTILGAQTGGLLDLGQGKTTYVDAELRYSPRENVAFKMRSTFARTTSDASGEFILGMSDVDSNAFAFGADIGNFSFAAAMPLAVSRGAMQYAHADYDIAETADGKYDLVISNTHIADVDLSPAARELRFTGSYRHNFGPFTDGAIGFIYRVNPNNTREFGNESIFMMKMTHRIGI